MNNNYRCKRNEQDNFSLLYGKKYQIGKRGTEVEMYSLI